MKDLRDLLRKHRPFNWFEMYCHECSEELIEKEQLTESVFKNEVLILYLIQSHARETGHRNVSIDAKPYATMKDINVTIEVNDNV